MRKQVSFQDRNTLGCRGYFFFLIDLIVRGEAVSNRKHGFYFILGILRTDLWSQGRIAKEKIHQNFPAAKCDIKLHSDAI